MKRTWWQFRLLTPQNSTSDEHAAVALATVVPALVRQLRGRDPDSRWSFQRPAGQAALDLRFHTLDEVGRDLARHLAVHSGVYGWPLNLNHQYSTVDGCRPEYDTDLSTAASDFALDLHGCDALAGISQLDLAVLHLWHVVDLVPEKQRSAFLFHCWQHWTTGLSPQQRVELGVQGDQQAEATLRGLNDVWLTDEAAQVWQRYLHSLRTSVTRPRPGTLAPVNYLLFEHAHQTHGRLGVPAAVESLAARILRRAVVTGLTVTSPVPMIGAPALQAA